MIDHDSDDLDNDDIDDNDDLLDSDINDESIINDTSETQEVADDSKRSRRSIEDYLERKRLRDELSSSFDDDFDIDEDEAL